MLVTAKALTEGQIARLASIAGFSTAYEAVIVKADGTTALIGYLRRNSMSGLDDFTCRGGRGERVIACLGSSRATQVRVDKKARVLVFSDGGATIATVKFSGRTERDAIYAGELLRLPTIDG